MNSETIVRDQEVEVVEVNQEEENVLTLQRKLEDKLMQYFRNKEIINERNYDNEIISDEIRELHERLGGADVVAELPNGTYAKVIERTTIRQKVDKPALASHIQVDKDELKTVNDFSRLTKEGILTPEMVDTFTEKTPQTKIAIRKLKKKPKKQKKENHQ